MKRKVCFGFKWVSKYENLPEIKFCISESFDVWGWITDEWEDMDSTMITL